MSTATTRVRRTLAATVLAAAATGLLAAPAHAAAVERDHDGVAINGEHSDFGNFPHIGGTPFFESGSVNFTVSGGTVRAVVSGRTFLDNLAGHAARTHIFYERPNGSVIAEDLGPVVSSTSGGLHWSGVWSERHTDPQIARVTILTELKNAGGVWKETGRRTLRLGD